MTIMNYDWFVNTPHSPLADVGVVRRRLMQTGYWFSSPGRRPP